MQDSTATTHDAMIETFQETGAVKVPQVLSREFLDLLDSGLQPIVDAADDYSDYYDKGELETTSSECTKRERRSGLSLTRQNAWIISPEVRQLLHNSPLPALAAKLTSSRQIRLYEDLMIYKAAGVEMPTPWHQDDPQWPLRGRQMCSAWFCLDPVDKSTGALCFVSGSHKGPRYEPYVAPSRRDDLKADRQYFEGGKMPEIEPDSTDYPIVCYDTEPGDVVFFHPRCIHGAFGSNPQYPRRTFSFRFLGDDVRWEPKKSVMYNWLSNIPLSPGQPVIDAHFPQLWPRQSSAPVPYT